MLAWQRSLRPGWFGVSLPLESAVLPSQKIIHFLFPFGFEEGAEEDGHHGQEAGAGHQGHQQPGEGGVWGEAGTGVRHGNQPRI